MTLTQAYISGYRDGYRSELPNTYPHFDRLEYLKGYVQGSIDRDKERLGL